MSGRFGTVVIALLTFSHASKEQAKARIALTGPSGSGKTYTALTVDVEYEAARPRVPRRRQAMIDIGVGRRGDPTRLRVLVPGHRGRRAIATEKSRG